MKITILTVGKIKDSSIKKLIEKYLKRINRFTKIKILEIKDSNKEQESKKIISFVKENSSDKKYFLLDERSDNLDSKEFSKLLDESKQEVKELIFIINGAYGPTKELKDLIKTKISLSKMTYPHEIAQLILIEQIYRGFTILKNIPYHKE